MKLILDVISITERFNKLILMLSILFFGSPIFSQTAYIEVKDANTGVALPEVTILFTDFSSLLKYYSSTNSKGVTTNLIANKSLLHISYTGFKTVVDTIYPKTSKTFFLETDVFNLDQVVVTAFFCLDIKYNRIKKVIIYG